jgi:peptidoglycan/xylan/chitin deacetylase (PgdA/CDA1 family)
MRAALALIGLVLPLLAASRAPADHGVILMYHHVDASTPKSTSVTPEQFERQLDFLKSEGFNVIPLLDLLDAVYANGALPEKAVAITFDDAYVSVYTEALPVLAERGMPFTVFVATQAVDQGHGQTLSWPQLREIAQSGLATLGAHSVSHAHLLAGSENGPNAQWRQQVETEIRDSVRRIEEEIDGVRVRSFAYPFGEYSPALEGLVAALDLYGLAQQSGAVGSGTPETAIPRFPIAHGYDSMQRLATALNSRPLPVRDVKAGNSFLRATDAMPTQLAFELPAERPWRRDQLACFSTAGERLTLAQDGNAVQVSLPPLRAGRNKINCTAPASTGAGEFFWYSHQWVVADPEGKWLRY